MLRSSEFFGGPERQIYQHALASTDSIYDVIVGCFATGDDEPELIQTASKNGLATKVFRTNGSYDPSVVRQLRDYIVTSHVDILGTHDYRASLIGMLAIRRTNCRWIAWSRGATREGFKVWLFQILERVFLRYAHRIVVVAKAQQDELIRWRVPARKCAVVHNAVNASQLADEEALDLHARFGIPHEALIIASAGRFSDEKGQHVLIAAIDRIVEKLPNAYFPLFGAGPKLDEAKKSASRLVAKRRVIFPGFEKDILGCIRGSDILTNPSLSEGLPNVVLEAMALGVPVVATAVGGVPELVTDGVDGRLVPADDSIALADSIVELGLSEELRVKLSKNAKATVRGRFSFESQARRLHKVYSAVLGSDE